MARPHNLRKPKGISTVLERIERHAGELRDDECWTTDYKPMPDGYVLIRREADDHMYLHRVAWEAYNCEPIPDGMVIMHTCDNRGCFNPAHLQLGTQADNVRDCVSKGRFPCHNAPKGEGSRPRSHG